jgi:hypothetical protein
MFRRIGISLLLVVAGCGSGSQSGRVEKQNGSSMPQKSIEQVLSDNTGRWMTLPGVVGTGIGECSGKPCIKIFASAKSDSLAKQIPKQIDGYTVELEVTGEFKANGGR